MKFSLLSALQEPGNISIAFQPVFELVDRPNPIHALDASIPGPQGTHFEDSNMLLEYVRRKKAEPLIDRDIVSATCRAAEALPRNTRIHNEIYRVMHSEVLESSKYPEVVFDGRWIVSDHPSRDVYSVKVDGSLRLHSVTNSHAFDARVSVGPDSFRAHGEFMVFQRDYGINIASVAGSTLKLRDELKFSFFVVGRKTK